MAQVYLSLGSNINRQFNISEGIKTLTQHFPLLSLSSVFESEAVGFSGNAFYNLVVGFSTDKSLNEVAELCRKIEFLYGREQNAKKYSPRTLDIDILLFDDLILTSPVQIPRDEILTNAFVLWPLSEIAADLNHPIKKQTYAQLWHNYPKETQKLKKVQFSF